MRPTFRHAMATLTVASIAGIPVAAVAAATASEDREAEVYRGSPRADQHFGTRYNDVAFGRGGPDALQGRRGMDLLFGGAGWDTLSGGLRSDLVWGSAGRDIITGGDAIDLVLEAGGDDAVNGGSGSDWILIGRGSDVLQAGAGRDLVLVFGDADPDTLQCGAGSDLVVYLPQRDRRDRFRGCEGIYDEAEAEDLLEAGVIELPPIPPIIDISLPEEEAAPTTASTAPAPMTSQETFRWSVRQLRASAR